MTIILTAGFLALLGATLEAQTSYFPLEVGNRWIYNGKWPAWDQRKDPGELVAYELAITDTVRIAPDFHRGMWTAERPPSASEGRLYFLLEGKEILERIGLAPSPYDEDAFDEDDEETMKRRWPGLWSPFDVLLVREAGTLDGIYDDEERVAAWGPEVDGSCRGQVGDQDLIVAGGARDARDGRWLLFEKDVPYWDFSPEVQCFSIVGLEVGGGVEFWYDFRSEPREGSLSVWVRPGGRQYITLIGGEGIAYSESIPSLSCSLVFEEGIGITRIAPNPDSVVLDLVDFTRGSETHVRPVSWGRLKKEISER